ncbi:hypothetical protein TNIN_267921 [Trichonephila inaurata madagascariensis]|uniref:Uncharacterized protein n=1 Tax=Trichonephila inaurata madagascariensis TaxID=2747483 RepID=A0A8X6WX86_9ARAC|nr:hypothetical protein TNIN_267921 [Trichonephila inaurata madagascariensis]
MTRSCLVNASWSLASPVCKIVSCAPPKGIEHGHVKREKNLRMDQLFVIFGVWIRTRKGNSELKCLAKRHGVILCQKVYHYHVQDQYLPHMVQFFFRALVVEKHSSFQL